MKKGDRVRVREILETSYSSVELMKVQGFNLIHSPKNEYNAKRLYRQRVNFEGMVIGYSFLSTGNNSQGSYYEDDYEPGYLMEDKRHKVWLVELLGSQRYTKPLACFEEDLEVINE